MIEHIKPTLTEYLNVFHVLHRLATSENTSTIRAYGIVSREIRAAWDRAWQPGNICAQVAWQELFPADRCPTVAEFIVALGREMSAGRTPPFLLN